jgi:hypothetical protein
MLLVAMLEASLDVYRCPLGKLLGVMSGLRSVTDFHSSLHSVLPPFPNLYFALELASDDMRSSFEYSKNSL